MFARKLLNATPFYLASHSLIIGLVALDICGRFAGYVEVEQGHFGLAPVLALEKGSEKCE